MTSTLNDDNENIKIEVDKNTNNLDKAWLNYKNSLSNLRRIEFLLPLNTPKYNNKIRILCISDTHTYTNDLKLPECDIFIHAGDFTRRGTLNEIKEFNNFLKTIKAKERIVIAGNHEITFQNKDLIKSSKIREEIRNVNINDYKKLLTNCYYLEDNLIELFGLKIYGSPWQASFRGWAFNADRGQEILDKWNNIPNNIDILVTHGPPAFIGDLTNSQQHVGCLELLNTIQQRVKPKYHIFGHVHESHGIWSDTRTIFINASICNSKYKPIQAPIIFDINK
jgi:Icc-related predicted phosphoesterase